MVLACNDRTCKRYCRHLEGVGIVKEIYFTVLLDQLTHLYRKVD